MPDFLSVSLHGQTPARSVGYEPKLRLGFKRNLMNAVLLAKIQKPVLGPWSFFRLEYVWQDEALQRITL